VRPCDGWCFAVRRTSESKEGCIFPWFCLLSPPCGELVGDARESGQVERSLLGLTDRLTPSILRDYRLNGGSLIEN
jgi:hypothetical protein